MIQAIREELLQRNHELKDQELNTIYFGGGTPSVLSANQLQELLESIDRNYKLSKNVEITMEANPDDLSPEYLADIKRSGINRLSIGIQSFHDKDLVFMNRTHNMKQSVICIENSRKAGFNNISIDLIYGFPGLTSEKWSFNLDQAIRFMPEHISAYHMTYEPGSILDYRRYKNKIKIPGENLSLAQYNTVVDRLKRNHYLHYEISSFSKPGFISRHNSAYWRGEKYMGVGPSAHSFDGEIRRWNLAKNTSYIKALYSGEPYFNTEKLTQKDRFHEYLMTGLRTSDGIDLEYVSKEWGKRHRAHCKKESSTFIKSGMILKDKETIRLSDEGMAIADLIISNMFMQP